MKAALFASLFFAACGPAPLQVTMATRLEQGLELSQAQSYQLWVLDLVGRDNAPIQCDRLLSRELAPGDPNVVKLLAPIEGNFSADTITVGDVPVGNQNRIFFLELFEQPGQLGTRIGSGCAQSVSILGGRKVEVDLAIVDPTAP
jgi:hypothetical protein